jgi:LPS export ABC transporter protein LptC
MVKKKLLLRAALGIAVLCASCTFNYEDVAVGDSNLPDISMSELKYTRMKNGELFVDLQAAESDSYDSRHLMVLRDYSFQQYDSAKGEVDAEGNGGVAEIELDTLNVHMNKGIVISVRTEDIVLQTESLDYNDTEKFLQSGEDDIVMIERTSGTEIKGKGFLADVRKHSFGFEKGSSGVWVEEEETDEDAELDEGEALLVSETGAEIE